MSKVANSPLKKGTAKTEAIIGTGVSKLNAAGKSLADAVAELGKLPGIAEDLSAQIADKQQQIAALNVEYAERLRQEQVSLELAIKQGEKEYVEKYLIGNGLVAVAGSTVVDYETRIAQLQNEQDNVVKKEVAIVTNTLKRQYESELALSNANFEKKEANNIAEIKSLNEKVKFLEGQVALWKQSLDEERKAGTERAKAQTSTVNVQGSSR